MDAKKRPWLLAALLLLPTMTTPARAQQKGFEWAPASASAAAPRVDALFNVELALTALIAGGVCLTILVFAFKYRRGTNADRSNAPRRNLKVELTWIFVPLALALGMFVWGARVYLDLYQPPPGTLDIYVVGKQWMWKLQHPEGQREVDELHVPVGRPVKLILTSQDVIHSFYVPAFRIKQDALPGRYTTTWFRATKPGRYHLFCSQYCGTNHSKMGGWVYVLAPADYERWLATGNQKPSMAERGARRFVQMGCSGCHGDGATVRAPDLAGLYGNPVPIQNGRLVIADERYLRDSILLPKKEIAAGYPPVMPSYAGQITEDEILEITAYIRSLAENPDRSDLPTAARTQGLERTLRASPDTSLAGRRQPEPNKPTAGKEPNR